jgi:hypothetical protein
MICIGRPLPDPRAMELAAGVITGQPIPGLEPANGFVWYDRVAGGIRLADGTAVRVDSERHPDQISEALRAQACEAEMIQAVGRLRPLRRPAENPYVLDIISDVPLPLSVDRVEPWDAAVMGRWALMADDGVILQSPADIMGAWPHLAPTRDRARAMSDSTMGETSIKRLYIGVPPVVRRFRYKPAGRTRQKASALVLPNGPDPLRPWLEERVGPLDWVTLDDSHAPHPANDNQKEGAAAA